MLDLEGRALDPWILWASSRKSMSSLLPMMCAYVSLRRTLGDMISGIVQWGRAGPCSMYLCIDISDYGR